MCVRIPTQQLYPAWECHYSTLIGQDTLLTDPIVCHRGQSEAGSDISIADGAGI